jgi:hypothetical protein
MFTADASSCLERAMSNAVTARSRAPRVHPVRSAALIALVALVGCASHYDYTFHLTEPGVHPASKPGDPEMLEDADVKAEVLVDGVAEAVLLDVTNKTDQVLQVGWAEISMTHPDGTGTTLRPDVDLGWVQPGAKLAARLFPLALPHTGSAAAANRGRRFQLHVPVIVRREAKVYHFTFIAYVRER